jgi:hypothetical protein
VEDSWRLPRLGRTQWMDLFHEIIHTSSYKLITILCRECEYVTHGNVMIASFLSNICNIWQQNSLGCVLTEKKIQRHMIYWVILFISVFFKLDSKDEKPNVRLWYLQLCIIIHIYHTCTSSMYKAI